jgi:hypothetical protein
LQTYIPVSTHQQHHSYSSEFIPGLSDIQEIKSPDIKKHVTFESPLAKVNDGVIKKSKEPTSTDDDTDSMYEPYVGLKKAPAAIRKKNMREKKEGLKGERFEEKKISQDEDGKESKVEKVEKHDVEKIGRFNVLKANVSKKLVKEYEGIEKPCLTERRPRRHTVHCAPVDSFVDEEKKRKSAVCAMTAYNVP